MPNELRGRVDELSKNSNKEIKKHKNGNRIHKKEPVTYAEYNNWNEEYIRGNQQISWSRESNQWLEGQGNGNTQSEDKKVFFKKEDSLRDL